MANGIAIGWRTADLSSRDGALCAYTEKLTESPAAVGEDDIASLRATGLDDDGISSATQVVAYFNYINRIAEGLGVPMETWLNVDGTTVDTESG